MKKDLRRAADLMDQGLAWSSTSEGSDYWHAVNKRLIAISAAGYVAIDPWTPPPVPQLITTSKATSCQISCMREAAIILNQNSILLHPLVFWDDVKARLCRFGWPAGDAPQPSTPPMSQRRRALLLDEERRRE